MIAFDNETHLISRKYPLPKVVCTSIRNSPTSKAQLLVGEDIKDLFFYLLDHTDQKFVGHSVAYDFGTMAATWPELLPSIIQAYMNHRVTDTGIRQQLWDISVGRTWSDDKTKAYSLSDLSRLLLKKNMKGKNDITGESWRLRYNELDGLPLEEWPRPAIDYALCDADTTYEIWDLQQEIEAEIPTQYHEAAADFALLLVSSTGMRTRPEAVAACKAMHSKKIAELIDTLKNEGLLVWDKKKNGWVKKQAPARDRIKMACARRGVEPFKTEKDAISVNKAACIWSGDEILLKRAKYITAEKMLSTYIPVLEQGYDLPVTTKFNLAATSRTTSSAPREPLVGTNLQNSPRKGRVRECHYPRPGNVYIAADFSGAELHTLAQFCLNTFGYSKLGEALNKQDVHLNLGAQLLGIGYDEALKRLKAKDKAVTEARQEAKAANFGFPGGMGPSTFIMTQIYQSEVIWEYEKAERVRSTWLDTFCEMEDHFELAKHELGPQQDAVITIWPSGMKRRVKGFSVCCNSKFQPAAAFGAKLAIIEATRRCYTDPKSSLYGSRIVNFVHDELILEVTDVPEIYLAVKEELASLMSHEFNKVTPDYPTATEATVMRYWSKNACDVYNEVGELIPWNG